MKNLTLIFITMLFFTTSCDISEKLNKVNSANSLSSEEINVQIMSDVKAGKDYYFEYEINFPKLSSNPEKEDAKVKAFNSEMQKFVESYLKEFEASALNEKKEIVDVILKEENIKPSDNHMYYSLNIAYLTNETADGILSVKFVIDDFSLGAHPNTYFKTFNFDLKKGEFLQLGDVLALDSEANVKKLNDLVIKHFDDPLKCFDITPTATIEGIQFSLTEEHIVFSYQPYLLGAYACGSCTILVPLSELKSNGLWKK